MSEQEAAREEPQCVSTSHCRSGTPEDKYFISASYRAGRAETSGCLRDLGRITGLAVQQRSGGAQVPGISALTVSTVTCP